MVPVSTNNHTHHKNNEYLLSLHAVRERCFKVQEAAVKNKLQHFDIDASKLQDMVQFVISLIKRDYDDPSQIPAHGRWRHFDAGGRPRIQTLINSWASLGIDATEQTRRVLDLFTVGVLLDMDPNQNYCFRETSTNRLYKKREGIAIAILEMFMAGTFSINPNQPHRVDSEALARLTMDDLLAGFKTDTCTSLIGLQDRFDLLKHLAQVIQRRPDYFDYLLCHPTTIKTKKGPLIHLETLWPVILEIGEIWTVEDANNCKGGTFQLGDAWPCAALGDQDHMVPFHKLSQWMVYSLIEPMEKLLGAVIEGTEQLTPLPDYANGGLLMDTGFITLKKKDYERGIENYRENSLLPGQPKVEVTPMFEMSDPVVVEWRALTTAYLDLVADRVRATLRMSKKTLSLAQLIEGGTTSAGRELAEISRPNTQEPPIVIKCDRRVIY
ncbi:conserved fungal protein [Mucor ambiguus]|uniref:Conserved fungal protein n=1 Tax=Mucor ambiguus TaxID=91626 RepID=A0A0C9LUG1_9FUNG|nr:conserved fungal protein [Mucor ambiguus]